MEGVKSEEFPDGQGLKDVKALELIDFQCNDLQDRHSSALNSIITCQYSLKDSLQWKLALRNDEKLNVFKLGIKCLILSRNCLGDGFAEKLSQSLLSDEYLRSICLKKNRIGIEGQR